MKGAVLVTLVAIACTCNAFTLPVAHPRLQSLARRASTSQDADSLSFSFPDIDLTLLKNPLADLQGRLSGIDFDFAGGYYVIEKLKGTATETFSSLEEASKNINIHLPSLNPGELPTLAMPSLDSVISAAQSFDPTSLDLTPLTSLPAPAQALLSFFALYALVSSALAPPPLSTPYPTFRYDPSTASQYFSSRPVAQLLRVGEITYLSSSFLLKVLALDKLFPPADPSLRGADLADLLTRLGPTFIKVGQSLSIRSDLLPPQYIAGESARVCEGSLCALSRVALTS